jgi:hypothetical protein
MTLQQKKATTFICAIVDMAKGYFRVRNGTRQTPDILFNYAYYTLLHFRSDTTMLSGMNISAAECNTILISRLGCTLPPTDLSILPTIAEFTISNPEFDGFIQVCTNLFLQPCVDFDTAENLLELEMDITELHHQIFDEAATAATFDILDAEPSASPELVATMIDSRVSRIIKKELNEFSEQFQKNFFRGVTTMHAPSTNKIIDTAVTVTNPVTKTNRPRSRLRSKQTSTTRINRDRHGVPEPHSTSALTLPLPTTPLPPTTTVPSTASLPTITQLLPPRPPDPFPAPPADKTPGSILRKSPPPRVTGTSPSTKTVNQHRHKRVKTTNPYATNNPNAPTVAVVGTVPESRQLKKAPSTGSNSTEPKFVILNDDSKTLPHASTDK